MTKLPPLETAQTLLARGRADPVWWIREVLGDDLWGEQAQIVESVRDTPETAVRSCHGIGKSFIAARTALWFLYTHAPSIVITTAPTDRQVRGILWKEIRSGHRRARYPLGGEVLTQELKLAENWFAWGFTAPEYDPDRFQGFHEVYVLVIVDEAAGVSQEIYEAIDSILTSEHARLLLIGNPTNPIGRFADDFKTAGVAKHAISCTSTPNFTAFGITRDDLINDTWETKITGPLPAPYLITPYWAAKMIRRWGADSQFVQARVWGEFPAAGTDALIPLHWIDAAVERTLEPVGPDELGVDVARFGTDETVLVHRCGPVARVHAAFSQKDTMATAGAVRAALRATRATSAKIDAVGIGAGVYDRLNELGEPVQEMQSGAAAQDSERFANARAEWWWGLRERFESGDIDIEDDEDLVAQLAGIKYKMTSRGQILIESKEDMKRRGLSSPDRGDALMLAFAAVPDEPRPAFFTVSRR